MAKASKSAATPARKTRKRLTPDQKTEVAQALSRGETGNTIAARLGISVATVYAQRRKGRMGATAGDGGSELRTRLVNFAVRTLLGQGIGEAERGELESEVRQELLKRVAAGI